MDVQKENNQLSNSPAISETTTETGVENSITDNAFNQTSDNLANNSVNTTPLGKIQFHTLTGFEAFLQFIKIAFKQGEEIWLKTGHDRFLVAEVDISGHFPIWKTAGTGTTRQRTKQYPDAFKYLFNFARYKEGGISFIPGKPKDLPLKNYCSKSDLLSAEMDDGTQEEQWEKIKRFIETSGLISALVISSGGKSLHVHWKLTNPVDIATRTYLQKLLALVLGADAAIVSPQQPMRCAGFFRKEKGKEQTLEDWSTQTYTLEQVLDGFKLVFKAYGCPFPESLDGERWTRLRKILVSKDDNNKREHIKEILLLSEEELNPPKPQRTITATSIHRQITHSKFNYSGATPPLETFLTRDDQELIIYGAGQGNRNNIGFKLAANIQATSKRLQELGIPFTGNEEQLFEQYALNCSPSLCRNEINQIWKSASTKGRPSLPDDKLQDRYRYWVWQQNPHSYYLNHEPDPKLYADYIAWQEEEERIAELEDNNRFVQWGKNLINKFSSKFKLNIQEVSQLARKVLIYKSSSRQNSSSPYQKIKYKVGILPTFEQYINLGCPPIKFIYKKGQRKSFWKEAVKKGWHYILDSSAAGSGKSHTVGNLKTSIFDVEKIWHLSTSHRNPTTITIEKNYTYLPPRHNGMKSDKTRKTPSGKYHEVRLKPGETPDIPGNCHRANAFAEIRNKNYQNIEGGNSPLCLTCTKKDFCPVIGYKAERIAALKAELISAHPASLPRENWDYSNQIAFWDDYKIKCLNSIDVYLKDFDQAFAELEAKNPEIHTKLRDFRVALRKFINKEITQPRYGWDYAALKTQLPPVPDDIYDLITEIEQVFQLDLKDFEEIDGVDYKSVPKHFRKIAKEANKTINREDYQDALAQFKQIPSNWLVPFLQIWAGEKGSFKCQSGKLTIFAPDTHEAEIAASMKANFFLDATQNPEMLALELNTNPTHILWAEEKKPNYTNLIIKQVTGLGKLSKERSESLTTRVEAIKTELQKQYPDIAVIDWKALAEDDEGIWFVDNRGSNRYQNAPGLISFGIPFMNLGYLQAKFQCLTGQYVALNNNSRDLHFQKFVNDLVQAEIIQTPGRLRSHRRPNETLTYFFVADYELHFLTEVFPGATIQQVDAFSITPEAGTDTQKSRWAILLAVKSLIESGQKLKKQDQITVLTNLTQGRISQIAKEVGGWKKLKKILAVLLDQIYSGTNISTSSYPPDPDIDWLAKEYLPLAMEEPNGSALSEIVQVAVSIGKDAFKKLVAYTPFKTKSLLLSAIFSFLSISELEELILFWDTGRT